MSLRGILDDLEPHFHKGGKWEKWYSLYEAVDTIFYSPPAVTKTTAHVRDGIDLKRIMITVWMCTFPAMFAACISMAATRWKPLLLVPLKPQRVCWAPSWRSLVGLNTGRTQVCS